MKTVHVNDKLKPYQCPFCDYKCSQKSDLQKHEESVHVTKMITCKFCHYKNQSSKKLKIHALEKHGKTTVHYVECNICYSKILKTNFKRHMDSKHKEKSFECTICEAKFTQKTYIKKHLNTVHHFKEINDTPQ